MTVPETKWKVDGDPQTKVTARSPAIAWSVPINETNHRMATDFLRKPCIGKSSSLGIMAGASLALAGASSALTQKKKCDWVLL